MYTRDPSVIPPRARGGELTDAAPPDRRSSTPIVRELGLSVVIKGELSGSEDLTISGQMDGHIRMPNYTLTIGPHADIKADISAKIVVVMGAVIGDVTAGEKVEIRATGSLAGDIVSPRLAIADGGRLRGRVQSPQPEVDRG
jgi:cytoskeletal protein CcmA (bactofilin family)